MSLADEYAAFYECYVALSAHYILCKISALFPDHPTKDPEYDVAEWQLKIAKDALCVVVSTSC